MIDIENIIIDKLTTALQDKYGSDFFVSSDIASIPSQVPAVAVEMVDNPTYMQTLDTNWRENHAQPLFQIDGYTNDVAGRKTQCKQILAVVDDVMQSLGLVRISGPTPTPNTDKYRMSARYRCIVSNDGKVYKGR